jgi:hypothetical protein
VRDEGSVKTCRLYRDSGPNEQGHFRSRAALGPKCLDKRAILSPSLPAAGTADQSFQLESMAVSGATITPDRNRGALRKLCKRTYCLSRVRLFHFVAVTTRVRIPNLQILQIMLHRPCNQRSAQHASRSASLSPKKARPPATTRPIPSMTDHPKFLR